MKIGSPGIASTSVAAFNKTRAKHPPQRERILAVLRSAKRPVVAGEIAELTGIAIHVVTARLSELRKLYRVDVVGVREFRGHGQQAWIAVRE